MPSLLRHRWLLALGAVVALAGAGVFGARWWTASASGAADATAAAPERAAEVRMRLE